MREQVEIAKMMAALFTSKYNADFDDLFSEALDKIPIINNNYIIELGADFKSYLKSSLRGYLKNYIRDHTLNTRVNRKISDIYAKTLKYSSYQIASLHTNYTEEQIRHAHETIRNYRSHNTYSFECWNSDDSLVYSEGGSYVAQLAEDYNINLDVLMDYLVYELSDQEMAKKHGKTWKKRKFQPQLEKFRNLCKEHHLYET